MFKKKDSTETLINQFGPSERQGKLARYTRIGQNYSFQKYNAVAVLIFISRSKMNPAGARLPVFLYFTRYFSLNLATFNKYISFSLHIQRTFRH